MHEPAIDLGVVLAVISSYRDQPIPDSVMVFGEVGLSGEIRAVSMAEQRVLEAKKLGFQTVILPKVSLKTVEKVKGIQILGVQSLKEMMGLRFT